MLLPRSMSWLLLRGERGDLERGSDDLAVLKERSCSMIQSRPLELVFLDFEVCHITDSIHIVIQNHYSE